MNKSLDEKRQELFRVMWSVIKETSESITNQVADPNTSGESALLSKYLDNDEARQVFRRTIQLAGWNLLSEFLDRTVDNWGEHLGYKLAFVDAESKKNLLLDEERYHDGLDRYIWDRQAEGDW